MMARRPDRLSPGKTVALFVAVAAVSVTALVWMGARLLTQERALEAQRLPERREAAADRAVAALGQLLLADERRLTSPGVVDLVAGDELLVVVASPAGIRVLPANAVPFYPVVPTTRDAPADLFSSTARLEFAERDHAGAIALLRPLALSGNPGVRAGRCFGKQLFLETSRSPAGGCYSHGSLGETRPSCAEVSCDWTAEPGGRDCAARNPGSSGPPSAGRRTW